MKLIYIAGPFRAGTQWEILQNVRKAEEKSLEVWRSDNVPITPHMLGKNFYGELDEVFVLDGLIKILSRCDGVLLLDDWYNSRGTLTELGYCINNNIPFDVNLPNLLKKINEKNECLVRCKMIEE
ncbi:MAG: hypothetical protein BV456_00685 [Thermoplasmata archaeon M8B2D]|nr:MAG: hypothetical protein BV456_00685 [Thermoplasmata archaeon M8B2D]